MDEKPTPTPHPAEAAYDTEIAPLMARVKELCHRLGVPFVASFQLDRTEQGPDGDGPQVLFAHVGYVPPGCASTLEMAALILQGDVRTMVVPAVAGEAMRQLMEERALLFEGLQTKGGTPPSHEH